MRAAVVERKNTPALVNQKDWAMAAVQDKSAFGFYLFEGARAHETQALVIHKRLTDFNLASTAPADHPRAPFTQPDHADSAYVKFLSRSRLIRGVTRR